MELAGQCDAMIVIGDQKSSNTRKLTQLCASCCPMVVQAERGSGIDRDQFQQVGMLGITAGASTPEWIIKEVSNKMSDEIMEIEQSFAEMLEESFKILNTGDRVTGTVAAITPTEVQVELGVKYPGTIPLSELSDDPDVKVEDIAKVGEEIEAIVMLVSDRDCVVKLSKKRLDADKNWETVENAVENRTCWRALSPRRTRAAWWPASRASVCLSPPPSPVSPVGPTCPRWSRPGCSCASPR